MNTTSILAGLMVVAFAAAGSAKLAAVPAMRTKAATSASASRRTGASAPWRYSRSSDCSSGRSFP